MQRNNSKKTKRIVAIALFSALAFVSTALCKFIPDVAGFLSLEIKDAISVICALAFGPLTGSAVAIFVAFMESFVFTYSITSWYGFVMDILSSVTFVIVASLIYKYKRSFTGAVLGLVAGVFSVTAVMLAANLLITPLYLEFIGANMPREVCLNMIPTVFLPFNFVKSTMNAGVVLILYKPITRALRSSGFLERSCGEGEKKAFFTKRTVIAYIVSIAVIAASVCVALFVLK